MNDQMIHQFEPANPPGPLTHSVLAHDGMFCVVYPTPGIASVLTMALICRTEQQAQDECDRRNGGLQ